MPTHDRLMQLLEQVAEAALDQPNPTPELRQALLSFTAAAEHPARIRPRLLKSA